MPFTSFLNLFAGFMNEQRHRKQLTGKIVSAKTNKTLIVEVTRELSHPKYEKRYRLRKKYQAHTDQDTYQVGDTVIIEESRPMSRHKHFVVIGKL
jgi:small subunit ribosomal protein S17